MSRVDALLDRLDKVRRTGHGTWLACCPAHADHRPSLSIRELDDGRILLHDFSGDCSAAEIVAAVGLDISDLFPPRSAELHTGKPLRRPFPASDALRAVAFESMFAAAACVAMASGEPVNRDLLITAAARINSALRSVGIEP